MTAVVNETKKATEAEDAEEHVIRKEPAPGGSVPGVLRQVPTL